MFGLVSVCGGVYYRIELLLSIELLISLHVQWNQTYHSILFHISQNKRLI